MERFFKRTPKHGLPESSQANQSSKKQQVDPIEFSLQDLPCDPGLRKKLSAYPCNERDQIRRHYLQKGPCQPQGYKFPQTSFGDIPRRFNSAWFEKYKNWLEYSISRDTAYCLCCYLFKPDFGKQAGGDAFVLEGFKSWNKAPERLRDHVGRHDSAHNKAVRQCEDLMNQQQSILNSLQRQPDQVKSDYRTRLGASLDCIRFLLRQGLAFQGHKESEASISQGNFLELLHFLADHNESINRVTLRQAPSNEKLTSHEIQTDIIRAASMETTNVIVSDLGDGHFSVLIDESRDISFKEQMAVVLRYVDKDGKVIERFFGMVHVADTSALSLKKELQELLSTHNLSFSSLRGQGYDGASNMRGEFNGLKSLILKENTSAYYVHCFAHQLQLTLVAVAKNDTSVGSFFSIVTNLLNVVGASCKRRDILRESQAKKVVKGLISGELKSGRGLNQERGLHRPADTRWSSHYDTLVSLTIQFSAIIDVLNYIEEDGVLSEQRAEANVLLGLVQSFDFIFNLHLMTQILAITNELSKALQRKDQDIVNAMELVKVAKERLQNMRGAGWDPLIVDVCSFSKKYNISILNMNDMFLFPGRSARIAKKVTNYHHYRVEVFCSVLDRQLQELNNRFTEASTRMLSFVACLSPDNLFSSFHQERLIELARFYPSDFSSVELVSLSNQLGTYIHDMRSSEDFRNLRGICALSQKLVEKGKHIVYPLVYLLLKLALILPVATASVERVFSAMNIVKNRLRNRMGDQLMNDCLVTYIEKDVFSGLSNEVIMQRFQDMKTRQGKLN